MMGDGQTKRVQISQRLSLGGTWARVGFRSLKIDQAGHVGYGVMLEVDLLEYDTGNHSSPSPLQPQGHSPLSSNSVWQQSQTSGRLMA